MKKCLIIPEPFSKEIMENTVIPIIGIIYKIRQISFETPFSFRARQSSNADTQNVR
jgi:hypothetical protein